MALDLRQLFKDDTNLAKVNMSEGHKAKFLEKLDK